MAVFASVSDLRLSQALTGSPAPASGLGTTGGGNCCAAASATEAMTAPVNAYNSPCRVVDISVLQKEGDGLEKGQVSPGLSRSNPGSPVPFLTRPLPNFSRGFRDELELATLIVGRQPVAFVRRCEPALRT